MLNALIEPDVSGSGVKRELTVGFERDGLDLHTAKASLNGSGEICFAVPWGNQEINNGEPVNVIFDLPMLGKTGVAGAIHRQNFGIDSNYQRIINYRIQLTRVLPQVWNLILDYCRGDAASPARPDERTKVISERKDIRVDVNIRIDLTIGGVNPVTAVIEDISYGGAKLRVPVYIGLGDEVRFRLVHQGETIDLAGTCVWVRPHPLFELEYSCGVRFREIDHDQYRGIRSLIFKASA